MRLRVGNLVKHKSGGPIMMVDAAPPDGMRLLDGDVYCSCVWVESRVRKFRTFRFSHLETVYADGSPRNYDAEK
ncbi:uncharacterized protein YodC (DUF2158 family) [Bradyrhizobium sp. AZCC 2176]